MRKAFMGRLAFVMATLLGANVHAADLTDVAINAKWLFPNLSTVIADQTVIDGPGIEIACPGTPGAFCSAWGGTNVSYDFGSNSITFLAPSGTGHAGASFNGYRFSGLAAGGAWSSATLATNIVGLDASRLSFDGDLVQLNVQHLGLQPGAYWTVTLTPAVPEASTSAMLVAGLLALGWGVVARRKQ